MGSLLMLTLLGTSGCEPTRPPELTHVPVSGRVTLDGEPLSNALVFFFPVRCWDDQGVYLPPSDALTDDEADITSTSRVRVTGLIDPTTVLVERA